MARTAAISTHRWIITANKAGDLLKAGQYDADPCPTRNVSWENV